MKDSSEPTTLFRWKELSLRRVSIEYRPPRCPACKTKLINKDAGKRWDDWHFASSCPLCGWRLSGDSVKYVDWCAGDSGAVEESICVSVLQDFTSDLAHMAIADLGAHLRQSFADVYALGWRRLEELVCDVFQAHGFDAVLTQPSSDGGADVLLFKERATGLYAIVQVKKYRSDRKVGVETVRALVGAAVSWDVRCAYLVTTSDFTSVARRAAGDYARHGYEIDLYAAADLFRLLGIYNERLPPIWSLTDDFRAELTRINCRILGEASRFT